MFITIEGIDGSGKTTQAKLLAEYCESHNKNVLLTREPGGSDVSEKIRTILLDPNLIISGRTELLLMVAARSEHVSKTIKPFLEKGGVVICERFSDSTFAYQGYARNLDISIIEVINNFAIDNLKPDLTLFFDHEPEITFSRLNNHDRMELEGKEFQEKVRNGFKKIAIREKKRFKVINVKDFNIEQVFEKVKKNVNCFF
ncbi:MAG: dTMP kinase [bacterium]|nr:dTMP kinase [bacterium]